MSLKVYIDGEYFLKEEAKVSVFDHGLLYGDGIFEGIRAYNGRVFRLQEHLERLYRSARAICIEIPISIEEMTAAVIETLKLNELRDSYIRLLVTRGKGDLGLDPRKCKKAGIIIITDKITLYPEETYTEGMKIIVASTRKNSPDALSPRIKSLNYLNNILGKMEAISAGYPEAVMLDRHGYLAECTSENLFLIKGDVVYTPIAAVGILEGITREVVMELCKELGYRVEETFLTAHDLYVADESFVTGTGAEIIPIVGVSGRDIGSGKPGPITRKLLEKFRALTQSEGTEIYT